MSCDSNFEFKPAVFGNQLWRPLLAKRENAGSCHSLLKSESSAHLFYTLSAGEAGWNVFLASKQSTCATTSIKSSVSRSANAQLDLNKATSSTENNNTMHVFAGISGSPMTQKGFLANFSLPPHPLYLQQQPADHILTMYSTPNTTMVTISWWKTVE